MKKVGILTLNGNFNVGNRLQNYALKKALENLGVKVETIWFTTPKENIKRNIKNIAFKVLNYKKKINFINFSKKNLNIKYYMNSRISDKYDYIIVGSDQVWNYNFPGFSSKLFLDFSPYEKNISYAASIGISEIADNYKDMFVKGINNIKSISVREDRAKEIVEELVPEKNAEVVVDPTMLLNSEEWDKLSRVPKKIPSKKFIFTYFLGDLSETRKNEIETFAKENDYEIVNILDKNNPYYDCGPNEFLYFEKNAELVCADSFHASVFAIIYNRPLIIFDREDKEERMGSRIDTLINKLKLKNVRYEGKITKDNLVQDYTEANSIIVKEKQKSFEFLKKALAEKE